MTERDALDPQTLVKVRIALQDGNIYEHYVGIGRCRLVEGGSYGVTCLDVKKTKAHMELLRFVGKCGPVLDEGSLFDAIDPI